MRSQDDQVTRNARRKGLPGEATDEYVVSLHQAVRRGMNEVEYARNDGRDQELRKGLGHSRVEGSREILTEEGRAGKHT